MEITFRKAKSMAKKYAKQLNKKIVSAKENEEYWFFKADKKDHCFDGGAGSCYISKKDGSLRKLNLIDMDFNSAFNETATEIKLRKWL